MGEPVTIKLFDLGKEEGEGVLDVEWVAVEGADDEGFIEMNVKERFLYYLGETALNTVAASIEQAVPRKNKSFPQVCGAGAGGSGITKLSKAGRYAVVMLKKALPKVSLALAHDVAVNG